MYLCFYNHGLFSFVSSGKHQLCFLQLLLSPFLAFLPSGIPIKHAGPPQFILSILSYFLLPLLVFP